MNQARIVRAGDSALVAEFEERIDPAISARAAACAGAIARRRVHGVRDIVPAFRTVTVYFDPLATDVDALAAAMHEAAEATVASSVPQRLVEIPVCYDEEFGPDLDDVCSLAGVTREDAVAIHTAATYQVFMLGFVPGFAYLGVVDARIAAPRRQSPRAAVPAGAVGIAGNQTGVYPRQTPGGWNIIGRTPIAMASLELSRPALLAAGDAVRFIPIDRAEFTRLAESGS